MRGACSPHDCSLRVLLPGDSPYDTKIFSYANLPSTRPDSRTQCVPCEIITPIARYTYCCPCHGAAARLVGHQRQRSRDSRYCGIALRYRTGWRS
jgi:hypothetical protein